MRNKIMALTIMILMASLLFATMPASAETLDPSDLPYGTYIIHKVDECVWLKNIDGDTCAVNQDTKIYAWQGLETLTLNTDAEINSIWVGGQDHDNGLTINGSGRLTVKNNEPGGSGFFAYGSITIDGCHVIADNNGGQGIESQGGDQNAGGIIVKNGGSLSTKNNACSGIVAAALEIDNAIVTSNGNAMNGVDIFNGKDEICSPIAVKNGGSLTVNNNGANTNYTGIWCASLSIKDGEVVAIDNGSDGVHAWEGSITVDGGILIGASSNMGIRAVKGDLIVTNGGQVTGSGALYGVYAKDIYVTGSGSFVKGIAQSRGNSGSATASVFATSSISASAGGVIWEDYAGATVYFNGATPTPPYANGKNIADIANYAWTPSLTVSGTGLLATANAGSTTVTGTRKGSATGEVVTLDGNSTHKISIKGYLSKSTPPSDPKPVADPGATFEPGANGNAGLDVTIANVRGHGMPLTITIVDDQGNVLATVEGDTDKDGKLHMDINVGDIPPGDYKIVASSSGNDENKGFAASQIGVLHIGYSPSVSGASDVTILPDTTFDVALVLKLSGSAPDEPVMLAIHVGGHTATISQTGDGEGQFIMPLNLPLGMHPIFASAPETARNRAIAETHIGTVTVVDASKYLSGDLQSKLGDDWLMGDANTYVPIAFQGDGVMLDDKTDALSIENKEALRIAINYHTSRKLTGTLSKVRQSPFAVPKTAQPVPARLELRAKVKTSKSSNVAVFDFSAQDMARLEPGYYSFAIQIAPSGKTAGVGPLTLATVLITDSKATPTEWTMPASLRISSGQQYQLVKPIPSGGALPDLTTATSNKKIATLNSSGVLSTKKSGTVTIKARAADGSVLKCKLNVVPNSFSRAKPLYIKGRPGIYTSTKRLYYEKGTLKTEIYVCNLSGQTIRGVDDWVFELYDGEQLIFQQPIPPTTFNKPLKHKKYAAYKLTLTDIQLPGITQKRFDLGSKRYQAVLRGSDALPINPYTPGAAQAKSLP